MTLPADLQVRLREDRPVLLDGGTGGELEDRGVAVDNPLWSSVALLTDAGRALNRGLHAEYAAAGAEILIANTHNLSLAHCEAFVAARPEVGLAPAALMEQLHARALDDARSAGAPWVAGCLASPDEPYSTEAHLDPAQVAERLRPQWAALSALSPDLVLFEMLTTDSDVRGVSALATSGPPRGAGLVCGPDGALLDGSGVASAVARLADAGFGLVFVQCTRFSFVAAALEPLLAAAEAASVVPGVYANDGRSWADGAWCGARISPEDYARSASEWVRAGARIVGGCCGTGPAHIRALNRPP